MNKATKGALAAGLGVAMLSGGAGTLAYWNNSQTVDGTAINAGNLQIVTDATNTGCGSWTLDTGESAPSTYNDGDPLVPGDVLTRSCAFTIKATGNHLRANLSVSAANFSGTDGNFGGMLTASLSGTAIDGTPVTSFTEDDNGKKLTTSVTVTFSSAALNNTKLMKAALDNIVVTATQAHG